MFTTGGRPHGRPADLHNRWRIAWTTDDSMWSMPWSLRPSQAREKSVNDEKLEVNANSGLIDATVTTAARNVVQPRGSQSRLYSYLT